MPRVLRKDFVKKNNLYFAFQNKLAVSIEILNDDIPETDEDFGVNITKIVVLEPSDTSNGTFPF